MSVCGFKGRNDDKNWSSKISWHCICLAVFVWISLQNGPYHKNNRNCILSLNIFLFVYFMDSCLKLNRKILKYCGCITEWELHNENNYTEIQSVERGDGNWSSWKVRDSTKIHSVHVMKTKNLFCEWQQAVIRIR